MRKVFFPFNLQHHKRVISTSNPHKRVTLHARRSSTSWQKPQRRDGGNLTPSTNSVIDPPSTYITTPHLPHDNHPPPPPPLPPTTMPALVRQATRAAATTVASVPRRTMASHSHGHESPYDQPSGWFLNQNPAEPPLKKEGWENVFFYGFFGSFFAAGVAYAYKPDTS